MTSLPHPKHLSISDFTYELPDERIAKFPLAERDASKLLLYCEGAISEDIYKNIANHIPEGALLVFNQTKVVNARLLFKKPTGGQIEVFCLAPHKYADIQTAMLQKGKVQWECLVGGAAKWKRGMALQLVNESPAFTLEARIVNRDANSFMLSLDWDNDSLTFAEVLHYAGKVPLPPYLHRDALLSDETRYQTIYARDEGSVAAPTAGLHFTDEVMQSLKNRNIDTAFVTLHVGAGTFMPVKSPTMDGHDMHEEWIDVGIETIERLIAQNDKKIVAVGTTSMRTLESLYWIGNNILNGHLPQQGRVAVGQWLPYEEQPTATTSEALLALKKYLNDNGLTRLVTRTQILIAPGYTFRVVSGLVTNFHQPQSTLLLLVAAMIGDQWRSAYYYAMEHDFRFLSYGDGGLYWCGK